MTETSGRGGTGGALGIDRVTIGGIGIDAVDVARVRSVVARRPSMVRRLFTPAELAYAERAADPAPRMATRFAAKEATMKALGVGLGSFPFTDVEVVRIGLGAPTLVLHGAAADMAERNGVAGWHLSLTHTDHLAMAFVVGERAPDGPALPDGPAPPGPRS